MNILIVYDNVQGAIKKIVDVMLETLKSYKLIQVKIDTLDSFNEKDLEKADLVMVGCPTVKWGCTPKMQKFLEFMKNKRVKSKAAVAFSTSEGSFFGGSAAKKIFKYLKNMHFNMIAKNLEIEVKNQQLPSQEIEHIKNFIKYIWMY